MRQKKCLRAQQKFVLLTGRRNQHDKAWKMHAWVRLLIFNDGMWPARLRSQQKSGKVNEFCWNSGNREVSFAHLGTYENMLVDNNKNLNDRSTTSLAGT